MKEFVQMLEAMEDPRTGNRLTYLIGEILFAAVCAVACNCRSYEDFADFAEKRLDFLRLYMPYRNVATSHDTFARVYALIKPAGMAAILTSIATKRGNIGDAVAIDGKALRGSAQPNRNSAALMTLSAFATDTGLVLGQVPVDRKSNEIPAFADLVRNLDLKGRTVTLDALHCQRGTAELLDKAGAKYVLSLRGNQKTLHADVALFLDDPHAVVTAHVDVDGAHGQIETRIARVSTDIARRLVLNCIRKAKTGQSVPRSMRAAVMDTEELRKILEQAFSS